MKSDEPGVIIGGFAIDTTGGPVVRLQAGTGGPGVKMQFAVPPKNPPPFNPTDPVSGALRIVGG